MYNAIFNKAVDTFQNELDKILRETISFNDSYENFYHGFIVGVLANMHEYIVKFNYKVAPRYENDVSFNTKLVMEEVILYKTLSIFEP